MSIYDWVFVGERLFSAMPAGSPRPKSNAHGSRKRLQAPGQLSPGASTPQASSPSGSPKSERKAKINELLHAFKQYDKSSTGTLGFTEFTELLKQGGSEMSDLQLRALFAMVDSDHNGRIEFAEFVQFIFEPPTLPDVEPPESVQKTFLKYAGRDGLLDGGQFARLCKGCSLCIDKKFGNRDLDIVFARALEGGGRKMDYERFQRAMIYVASKRGLSLRTVYDVVGVTSGSRPQTSDAAPDAAPASPEPSSPETAPADPPQAGADLDVAVKLVID